MHKLLGDTVRKFICTFLLLLLLCSSVLGHPRPESRENHPQVELVCQNPTIPHFFDYSVKSRDVAITQCPSSSISRRAVVDDYSCSKTKPCKNGACCPKVTGTATSYCSYGPAACGTNGQSPNDVCWSNCDAHAECGKNALPAGKKCPLNVCCSEFGFCGMTEDFCKAGSCQSNCAQPGSGGSGGNVQGRIVGYYEAWAHDRSCSGMKFQDIPVESLTHINFAFGYITPDFQIAPMDGLDASLFSDFTALKSRNGNVKATISLGGWTFTDNGTITQPVFSSMVSSSSNRQKFITNLFAFLLHFGFDGVDFDWEYPGAPDRGGQKEDGVNYTEFLKELQTAIAGQPKKYEVSFTAPTSYWYLRWFDLKNMMQHVDFANVMSYDLHGVWDAEDPIGNTVLAHTNLTEIKSALDLMWRNGVPAGKLNLGLGFYGRSFQLSNPACWHPGCQFKGGAAQGPCTKNSGTLSYKEITDIIATQNLVPYYDQENAVKYITWNRDQWVSYDDQQTFQQKIKFANGQGLGGLLIWALDLDTGNLDALRGVLFPKPLAPLNRAAETGAYWESSSGGDCGVTECGGSCKPGEVPITTQPCGKSTSTLCCPISAAPDPKNCQWHGNWPLCDGQCDPGQVALESNKCGDGKCCNDGLKFYCCDIPEAKKIDCSWKDKCTGDDVILTFAGTFLGVVADAAQFFGLVGSALSDALRSLDIQDEKQFCCSPAEAKRWTNCAWAGTTGKGPFSCDDNHCATGHQVELAKSEYGEGKNCGPAWSRTRAFCCDPANGKSPFLPVPLIDLFPNAPNPDTANPIFNLKTDDTWGTGHVQGKPDPNDATFGFVVITSPEAIQVSLDKRDGSHWEVFDCFDSETEGEHSVRMVCTDHSPNSNCNKIHLGHGAPGTILEMPTGCGPGKYAVAKSLGRSTNQTLPHHLAKRSLIGNEVYDLKFDYDFARVPRDLGNSQMRVDFSNEEGHWDSVVNKTGETKRKRSLEEVGNHKRWLEEEWRDDLHYGALSEEELHKRWFGSSVVEWLKNLITTGSAAVTEQLHHSVDETIEVIIVDEQWGPCPIGPAQAQANIKATVSAHLQVDTSFGVTIITTLAFPPDLSNSYLYFKNKGSVTAKFQLDAVASLTYSSGDIHMIGLDDFPGATFRVPGIVTVGPNVAVYGSIDATLVASGHLQSEVNIAKWETQQTYPQTPDYAPKALTSPDSDGTQTLGVPTFDWAVSASGDVTLHIKPTITFGIVFDARWKVDKCAVDLVADGYMTFHASAQASSGSNTCPFTYGIDAGADLYVQLTAPHLFNWGGTSRIPIGNGIPRRQITPGGTCPAKAKAKKRDLTHTYDYGNNTLDFTTHGSSSEPESMILANTWHVSEAAVSVIGTPSLRKRDNYAIGPIIRIPERYLECPGGSKSGTECPLCGGDDAANSAGAKVKARALTNGQGDSLGVCPGQDQIPDMDAACTNGPNTKRALTNKLYSLSWVTNVFFSTYPGCDGTSASVPISKWWLPLAAAGQPCTPQMTRASIDNSATPPSVNRIPSTSFNTDHVFEVHLVSDFLEWLCAGGTPRNYPLVGPINFPRGWTRPDIPWCNTALGADGTNNYQFFFDGHTQEFMRHAAEFLGGDGPIGKAALTVLYEPVNALKKLWLSANLVTVTSTNQLAAVRKLRNSASVFQFLQDPVIVDKWTQPSNAIEAIANAFDGSYPWNGPMPAGVTGVPIGRPPQLAGLNHWGLRNIWCYWIDNHLNRVELLIGPYLQQSRNTVTGLGGGSSQLGANFIQNHMQPGGMASTGGMHFPRANNFAAIPLPGTANSGTMVASRYGMWGGQSNVPGGPNAFGAIGI